MQLLKYTNSHKPVPSLSAIIAVITMFLLIISSCKKLIDIPPPVSTVTTKQVFATPAEASAALAGIYSELIMGDNSFSSYATTIFCGLSADELTMSPVGNENYLQFSRNNLFDGNVIIINNFWTSLFANIYRANAIMEGLQSSSTINDSIKAELEGEARFIRAFCNFYLVNLFGPVPLVTTSNWRENNLLGRAPVENVYQLIVADLKEAKTKLAATYAIGKGERIIPNKTAATALLARVYLYLGKWADAVSEATEVINTPGMVLESLPVVFKTSSKEALWQLKQNNTLSPSYNGTPEGLFIRPRTLNTSFLPQVWVPDSLLTNMQPGDLRVKEWLDSTKYSADQKVYYFPNKYKQGAGEVTPNGAYAQYYVVLRLAEQYLIRAEALLMRNHLSEATTDINRIRQRAGLQPLGTTLTAEELMTVIIEERRAEFFSEWGHRWMDLKRWGIADIVLGLAKGSNWQPTDKLWPIPAIELGVDPNLDPNEGY